MIDVENRVPSTGKEGRVKITLDNGQTLEGIMEMADEAFTEGTPWNRRTAQLLQADRRWVTAGQDLKAGDVVDVDENGVATASYDYGMITKKPFSDMYNGDFVSLTDDVFCYCSWSNDALILRCAKYNPESATNVTALSSVRVAGGLSGYNRVIVKKLTDTRVIVLYMYSSSVNNESVYARIVDFTNNYTTATIYDISSAITNNGYYLHQARRCNLYVLSATQCVFLFSYKYSSDEETVRLRMINISSAGVVTTPSNDVSTGSNTMQELIPELIPMPNNVWGLLWTGNITNQANRLIRYLSFTTTTTGTQISIISNSSISNISAPPNLITNIRQSATSNIIYGNSVGAMSNPTQDYRVILYRYYIYYDDTGAITNISTPQTGYGSFEFTDGYYDYTNTFAYAPDERDGTIIWNTKSNKMLVWSERIVHDLFINGGNGYGVAISSNLITLLPCSSPDYEYIAIHSEGNGSSGICASPVAKITTGPLYNSKISTSKDAVVLSDAISGDTVEIVYSGDVFNEDIPQEDIFSGGVSAIPEGDDRLSVLIRSTSRVFSGKYTGNGAMSRTFNFGFTPKLMLIYCAGVYGIGIVMPQYAVCFDSPSSDTNIKYGYANTSSVRASYAIPTPGGIVLAANVSTNTSSAATSNSLNISGVVYNYIAFA